MIGDVERGADAMIQRQLDRHLDATEYSDVELEEAYELYLEEHTDDDEPLTYEAFCETYERSVDDAPDYDPYDEYD